MTMEVLGWLFMFVIFLMIGAVSTVYVEYDDGEEYIAPPEPKREPQLFDLKAEQVKLQEQRIENAAVGCVTPQVQVISGKERAPA